MRFKKESVTVGGQKQNKLANFVMIGFELGSVLSIMEVGFMQLAINIVNNKDATTTKTTTTTRMSTKILHLTPTNAT